MCGWYCTRCTVAVAAVSAVAGCASCFIGSRPRPRAIFPVMHSHGTLTSICDDGCWTGEAQATVYSVQVYMVQVYMVQVYQVDVPGRSAIVHVAYSAFVKKNSFKTY